MRLISAFTSDTDKALWRLALPMIFSNITVPLLGLVDTAVIGHLDSPIYLGGVAIGAVATSFLFMLLLFLRMSTTGLAAQALGAQNPQALARAFMQPLLLALLAGAAIVLLRYPLIELALRIVGGDGEVLEQARRFLEIRWLSAPAALANLVLLGWLLGVQYVRAPVILLIVGNLLNIVLDIWLVMGLGWNVRGAAAATAIAEYATLLLGLWLAWRVMRLRGITLPMLRQAWRGDLRRLLALNRDIMLRSLLLQLCFASLTIFGARLGSEVVAVNAVLMNLLTFTAYAPATAITAATEIATIAEAPTARRRTASSLIGRRKAMGYFRILVPALWLPVPLPWLAHWPAVTAVRLALRRPQPLPT